MENVYNPPASELVQEKEEVGALFYGVSSLKLTVMSVFTFGLYNFYWFYKNFAACKRRYTDNSMPLLRAIFSPIFSYSLFTLVNAEMDNVDIKKKLPAGPLAIAYFLFNLSGRVLPGIYSLISILTFLPLVGVNNDINRLNFKLSEKYQPDSKFTLANWLVLLLGIAFLALAILGFILGANKQ